MLYKTYNCTAMERFAVNFANDAADPLENSVEVLSFGIYSSDSEDTETGPVTPGDLSSTTEETEEDLKL